MAYTFKKFRKQTKKVIPMVRKGVRSLAKAYLGVSRSGAVKSYRKTGVISSTAIAKSLSNLKAQVNSVAEYKSLEQNHTAGSANVALREYYRLIASDTKATVSSTSVPGTSGYFLQEITYPTRGDGLTNFDGKRFNVSSIQWKGTMANINAALTAKAMIVRYDDEDMDQFQMTEFIKVDNNSEFSVNSRRNPDYKNYKVMATRNFKFSSGQTQRKDFNIFVKPNHIVRINEADDAIYSHRYFLIILVSSDVASNPANTVVDYQGSTRMRFVA